MKSNAIAATTARVAADGAMRDHERVVADGSCSRASFSRSV